MKPEEFYQRFPCCERDPYVGLDVNDFGHITTIWLQGASRGEGKELTLAQFLKGAGHPIRVCLDPPISFRIPVAGEAESPWTNRPEQPSDHGRLIKRLPHRVLFLRTLGLLVLIVVAWYALSPRRLRPPSINATGAGTRAIADYDSNNDGALADLELNQSPGLKNNLDQIDRDGDGRLTAAEISARVATYMATGVTLFDVFCEVTLNGRTVNEAVITLTPEPFLGTDMLPTYGITDEDGKAILTIDDREFFGVQYGMYRVAVSKVDEGGRELLPPRYNTRTELSAEIGPNAQGREVRLRFELTSQ